MSGSAQKITPEITPTADSRNFHVAIKNIQRNATQDIDLKFVLNAKALNISQDFEQYISIPASATFKVISAEIERGAESAVVVAFSDALDDKQNLKGLVEIEELKNFNYLLDNNKIYIYFDAGKLHKLNLTVNKNIKNFKGEALGVDFTKELAIEQLKPQVEFLEKGNILPFTDKFNLAFRAVNLRAVDVKVIQIYESNALQFFQGNDYDGSEGLRRVGRLVYKKTLLFNQPPEKYHFWQTYLLDLSKLINRESGAIYRIMLSFKQNYSTYECDDKRELGEATTDNLAQIASEGITEADEAYWDAPNSYYYDSYGEDYDWNVYEWRERENPCNPSYYMAGNQTVAANVLASNIGIIAKANADNKMWISAADIISAKPLSSVEITAYSFQLQKIGAATTDADGFAVLEPKGKAFLLVARQGKQKTYLRVTDGESNSVSRFDTGGKELQKGLKGYVYGERGVWRPGDTLHLSFILFDSEKRIPANHPVTLELYNPLGQFYTKLTSTQGVNGFYVFHVPTSQDDATGVWNGYVKIGGATFHKPLRIETIKPNRLKINLDLGAERIDAGKTIPLKLSAQWLTGVTAKNLKAKVELTLRRKNTVFKGYENYTFSANQETFHETSDVFEGRLDESGNARFDLKVPKAENAPAMLNATFVTRVFEAGGDASVFSQSVTCSPYDSYVGLLLAQERGSYFDTDKPQHFSVVSLSSDGKPLNSEIEYKVYKVDWNWWWDNSEQSAYEYLNARSYRAVAQGMVKTANGKASFDFTAKRDEWGRYVVYVKDTKSGHTAGGFVYFDYPDYYGRAERSDPEGVKMLTFTSDKKEYEAGEKATVVIPASAGGVALVAFENGRTVLKREWVTVKPQTETRYTFEITKEMTPNCYIHISLLQPHSQTVNDLPMRMYGVIPVLVNDKNTKLEPQIAAPDVLRPETEFTVKVSEKNGKPMTYTLAIVDDGLLDLTNFKTPNAWNEFYVREKLGIRTWDMYDKVIGAFAGRYGSLFGIGGDEDLKNGAPKANRFKPVVKFIGPFTLGGKKTNQHKLKLPMYVGSVRVMLVAGQDGAYGNAEKTLPVRSPLMLLSTLPRTLSVNESISLPVNVFAMENDVKNVTVKIKTANNLVKLDGDNSQNLKFDKPSDAIVYFKLKTSGVTGVEKITVSASGNGHETQETVEIAVRNPNPPIVISENKLLNAGETAELAYYLGSDGTENRLRLEAARIPSVDISRRFDFLYSYQHYCSEQITSCAFPMLYIAKFKELAEREKTAVKENIPTAIQQLYTRQTQSGGFLYWANASSPNDWITSYVGHFLLKAKENGYNINEGVLNRWKTYQQRVSRSWTVNSANDYYRRNSEQIQAYRLYTLALAGATELGAMNRLKETKELTLQARWLLAAAYAVDGKKSVAEELIFNQPTAVAKYSGGETYGSPVRDEAIMLQTMLCLNRLEDAFRQAQRISAAMNAERYFDTQSNAFALMAMGELAAKASGTISYDWTLNGKKQTAVQSSKAIVQTDLPVPFDKGDSPQGRGLGNVSVTNKEKGVLYINLISKTSPLSDTLPAISENLRIEVTYFEMDGKTKIDVASLSQGTDFIAEIKVTNISPTENYNDLALTQIIPSGWEIVNERLTGTDGSAESTYAYRDIRDDRVMTYFSLARNANATYRIRLQSAYIGSFTLPAVRVEDMYNTSAQARTKAGKVECRM
ncbi:MAG: alpha-2-macroglobulin [Paludibacter sp.]|nr:alpha-2-macroglobulin [Paludibacter sp.]